MKIVSVCRVYPTQRPGGMPFVAMDRAEELARQGHEVHVLTTGGTGEGRSEHGGKDKNGVWIHYLPGPAQAYSSQFAEGCAFWCKELLPDVIHLDSFDRERVWWKDRPGNPKVVAVTMHGNQVGTDLTKWNLFRDGIQHNERSIDFRAMDLERIGLKNADRVLAVSLNEEWQLRDVLALSQTRLVYNPIPSYFFSKEIADVPENAPFLCAAVSGHKERGFDLAKKVAEACGRELMVVKAIPRTSMPSVYDSCAAVLLPTRYAQGYDLTVAEANARGRGVYATPTGSYLRERHSGLKAVKGFNVEDFVEAIRNPFQSCHFRDPIGLIPESISRHKSEHHVINWLSALGV